MRAPILLSLLLLLSGLLPGAPRAQEPLHVAIEATTLVVDESRLRRLGLSGAVVVDPSSLEVAGGRGGDVRVAGRVGGLEVAAWLDVVRRQRAVERESTQRIVVLSGSAAELSSQRTVVGRFGHAASAGPAIWVEPVALPDGRVRLRLWSTMGEVHAGPYGTVYQEVPIEARTEVVVESGTPVMVASTRFTERGSARGILNRTASSATGEGWIVITARVAESAADALPR
jgi:hypothetical protein